MLLAPLSSHPLLPTATAAGSRALCNIAAAVKQGKPVAILNQGETRAEKAGLPLLKIDAGSGTLLPAVADEWERLHGSAMQ